MSGSQQEGLRATFEQVPEVYDRARPSYPPEIFDDLDMLAQLPPAARIVEIGCGTGQATVPLADRGYAITCLELGEQLAALARRKVTRFPHVEVINTSFEGWRPERSDFDAVVAFSSFHWIPPEVRYRKAAELLHQRGKLVVVSTVHVLPDDGDRFFIDVQADYDAVVPDDAAAISGLGRPPHPDAVATLSDEVLSREIRSSGLFSHLSARRYLWDVVYTADEYVELLNTYSGYRALGAEIRERLLARIHRRIEAWPERSVRRTYLALLYVAERT